MNKVKYISGAIITLMALTFLSGCQQAPAPTEPPEKVIKDAMVKSVEVKSYSYEIALKGDMVDEAGEAMKLDISLNGFMDGHDPKDPKFLMNLNGLISDAEQGGTVVGEMRMNKDAVFFKADKLEIGGAEEMVEDMADMIGKWWKITLPEDALDELEDTLPQGEEGELTPEQMELKEALEEAEFFITPEYVGVENVKSEPSYRYQVLVDKDALIEFGKKSAEARGETITAADLEEAKDALEKVDITGGVWVGVNTGTVTQISADVDLKGGDDMPTGTITLLITLWDMNKPMSVEVPSGAEEFPIEDFLAPFMMMGTMDESMLMEDAIDAGMTEEELMELMESMPDEFEYSDLEDLESMGVEMPEEFDLSELNVD